MKPSRILITLTAFLLILSLSASVLAAQPGQGVYVKRDSAGNVNALMYVIAKQGKGPMASAAYELSITLEAVDTRGNTTEQMVSDYVENEAAMAGTGLEGFRLTGENLRNSLTAAPDSPLFSPEHFSAFWGQYVEYGLPGPDRVVARGCSANLDGTYVYDGSRECYVTLPALIFIYERTFCRDRYENKHAPQGYYALARDPKTPGYHSGKDYVVQVKNPSGEDHRYLIADDQMNLVMETRNTENRFLFTGNDYNRWIDGAWRAFAGSNLDYVNSLFLYQYLTRNAPDLLEKPGMFFRQTDSWKGKADVVTREIEVLQPENGAETKLGTALVGSHGTAVFRTGAENTFKKPKKRENKK